MEVRWQFLSFLSASTAEIVPRTILVSGHVPTSGPQIPVLPAEEKLVAQSEAAVPHGRAAMQFPAELWSQPSTISLVFQPSKEVLAPGRLISFGTELL